MAGFAAFLIFSLTSCATHHISLDLIEYVNQGISGAAPLEKKAIARMAAVTGKNFTSVKAIQSTLKDEVIPTYKRYVVVLKIIKPETDEVRQLHAMSIRSAELTLEGFKTKLLGIEKMDAHIIREGNSKIIKAQKEGEKWRQALFENYKKYNAGQEGKLSAFDKVVNRINQLLIWMWE